MSPAGPPRSWSDLPTELAGLILCCLPAYSDRVRFGVVCRQWSFSLMQHRLPSPLPCLALNDGTFVSLPNDGCFRFPDTARYHSSYGQWLVFSCDDGACYLKNPFSKVTLKLPDMSCHCLIEEPVKIINGRSYTMFEEDATVSVVKMLIVKVIVCSNLLIAAIVSLGCAQTVALCQPGAESWFLSDLMRTGMLMEMTFYEGKLYVINADKDLSVINVVEDNDTGKLSISRIERLIETPYATHAIWDGLLIGEFLVESQGALLLVCETIFGTSMKQIRIEYKVFKADFPSSQWVGLTSVGDDQVLFVSRSYSQSFCVSQYKLKGNRVFILNDSCRTFDGKTSSYTIYNMSNGRIYLPNFSRSLECGKTPVTWLFPQ